VSRVALVLAAALAGCAAEAMPIEDYPCPQDGTQLTYESFGRAFMAEHCDECHSAGEGLRKGAPASFRFDTLAGVRARVDRIFVRAAASNTTMPPGADGPSADARDRLAEWLACGAP